MRTSLKARTVLICFGAAILALAIALAAAALFQAASRAEQSARLRVVQLALDLSADLDRDIERHVTVLNALAILPSLGAGDWPAFYAEASAALRGDGYIVLIDRDLHQIVNTYVPYGKAPERTGDPETAERVLRSRQPEVSDGFVSQVTHTPVFNIDVPVLRDGEVRYILIYGRKTEYLLNLISDLSTSADWARTIFDRKGAVLADSQLRSPDLSAAAETRGPDDLRADTRVSRSGWLVRVHSSPERIGPAAGTGFLVLAAGLSALLLLAVGGSFALGKLFARDLEHAASAAHALARGDQVKLAPSAIREIDVVGKAIFDASKQLAERERDQALLRRELQHRVGNMIAVVQALVIRLARGGYSPEQLKIALSQRLEALARAQDLIANRDWHTVPLREILEQELAAFSENVTVAGLDVLVEGSTVQTFALLIHELATNAIKHGAFRSPEGSLTVTLGFAGDVFSLVWEERGPAPEPAQRKGFGTQLLDSVFAHPRARRRRAMLATGFIFELHLPADVFAIRIAPARTGA